MAKTFPQFNNAQETFASCRTIQREKNRLGPVVRRPIGANPGLNFHLGFKSIFRIIFSILFRASNHQIVDKKNKT